MPCILRKKIRGNLGRKVKDGGLFGKFFYHGVGAIGAAEVFFDESSHFLFFVPVRKGWMSEIFVGCGGGIYVFLPVGTEEE